MQETDPKQAREAAAPHLSLREISRKLGLNHVYVMDMENGLRPWASDHKARYLAIVAAWKKNPSPTPRKPRTVKPKRRRALAHAGA